MCRGVPFSWVGRRFGGGCDGREDVRVDSVRESMRVFTCARILPVRSNADATLSRVQEDKRLETRLRRECVHVSEDVEASERYADLGTHRDTWGYGRGSRMCLRERRSRFDRTLS